jgi:transcriptional regulator with XRE-family HTH domain
MSIAIKIKELRLKKGVSLQSVADAVGASKPHIWELERGASQNPSLELVRKLAQYFGVTVDYLAGLDDIDTNSSIQAFARELETKNLSQSDLDFLRQAAETLSQKNRDGKT